MHNNSAERTKAANAKKIVVIGGANCGKTHLIRAFIELTDSYVNARKFCGEAHSNIDIDDTNFSLKICEASCLQNLRGARSEMYKDTDVVIMCFAVDDMLSFLGCTGVWLEELQQNRPDVPLVLVGNKCDLNSRQFAPRTISYSNGKLSARNINAFQYVECSAKTKEGILDVFIAAVKATLK